MRPRAISTVLSLIKTALFALQSLCKEKFNSHIQLQSDNSTTVACINNKGSTKPACNDIARDIWCLERHNFVSAVHIAGSSNIEADFESWVDRHEIEWRLDERLFQSIVRKLDGYDIDLFASRVNAQLKSYVSWRPDPDAMAVDAFTLDWSKIRAFCFPPFSLTSRVLQMLELCQAECMIVVPFRKTRVWFTKLLNYW